MRIGNFSLKSRQIFNLRLVVYFRIGHLLSFNGMEILICLREVLNLELGFFECLGRLDLLESLVEDLAEHLLLVVVLEVVFKLVGQSHLHLFAEGVGLAKVDSCLVHIIAFFNRDLPCPSWGN